MMNKKLNVAEDATALFEQLKCTHIFTLYLTILVDKTQNTIDKSTLQALLLYCDVDRVDSLFFNSLNKKIEEHKGEQINLQDFIRIFDFAKDPFPKMNTDELSQVKSTFSLEYQIELICSSS